MILHGNGAVSRPVSFCRDPFIPEPLGDFSCRSCRIVMTSPPAVMSDPQTPHPAPPAGDQGPNIATPSSKKPMESTITRPVLVIAVLVIAILAGVVYYLETARSDAGLPPPVVSYTLLPNQGRTDGVPIAIKLNQIAVFMISDPIAEGSGAVRARALVERMQLLVNDLYENPGHVITISNEGGLPSVVEDPQPGQPLKTWVQMTDGDLAVAGETDAKRLIRLWAERLTDTLKVLVFAEEPEFTKETDFGRALLAMLEGAKDEHGVVSATSLQESFANLTDEQRLVLETLPLSAPAPSATALASGQ